MNASEGSFQYELIRPEELTGYEVGYLRAAANFKQYKDWLRSAYNFLPWAEYEAIIRKETLLYKDLLGDIKEKGCRLCGK
jgi:hypothetical protein